MNPILTHEWGFDGRCRRCNESLLGGGIESLPLATPVGKVDTVYGGTRVYVIGEKDSNQKCEAKK